jgi:hypothetical protein
MARKFKTGDRVRVCVSRGESEKIGGWVFEKGIRKGCTGIVTKDYDRGSPEFPYSVELKKDREVHAFNARELEKI